MSPSNGVSAPVLYDAPGPDWEDPAKPRDAASDACMFCSDAHGLRSSGEDPLGFLAHLDESNECKTEYELWKQVITDEWHGD